MNFRPPSSAPTFRPVSAVYAVAPSAGVYRPSAVLISPEIRYYQWVLADLAFLPDMTPRTLDGVLGDQTKNALKAFQRTESLPQTGYFDPATVTALNRASDAALRSGHTPPILPGLGAITPPAASSVHTMVAPVVTGTHPPVTAITTAATPMAPAATVTVPPTVARMIPPAAVAQLQTMSAPQVQSFVNDLVTKVLTGPAHGDELLDAGTGKPATTVEITAVPVVGPNGNVTAGVARVPVANGWWGSLSETEKAAWGIGGGVAALATAVILWKFVAGNSDSERYDRDGRRR